MKEPYNGDLIFYIAFGVGLLIILNIYIIGKLTGGL